MFIVNQIRPLGGSVSLLWIPTWPLYYCRVYLIIKTTSRWLLLWFAAIWKTELHWIELLQFLDGDISFIFIFWQAKMFCSLHIQLAALVYFVRSHVVRVVKI